MLGARSGKLRWRLPSLWCGTLTARFFTGVWQRRGNLTAYDAAYVALAEALEAPLGNL